MAPWAISLANFLIVVVEHYLLLDLVVGAESFSHLVTDRKHSKVVGSGCFVRTPIGQDRLLLIDFNDAHRPLRSARRCYGSVRRPFKYAQAFLVVVGKRDGALLDPGTHVNAAGGNSYARCEVDDTTITRSSVVAVDNLDQAKMECGELIAAADRGVFRWGQAVELHQIVSGQLTGRPTPDAITLFESQGIGTEDTACYAYVLRQARELGIGTQLPF